MSRVAYPFLTLPDDVIEFQGWLIGKPGEPLAHAHDTLDAWDYEYDVSIAAEICIDLPAAAKALQLPARDLQLAAVLAAGTGAGSMARRWTRCPAVPLVRDGGGRGRVEVTLAGSTLSGRILLDLQIVLDAPTTRGTILSPSARGSRLWRTRKDILLEDGGDSRFPVELISFSKSFPGRPEQFAPWFLFWRPASLSSDFGGSVRLYVNADNETVAQRFIDADAPTLQAMLADVMSQMIAATLDQEDCAEQLAACEEGSVGSQIGMWMENVFPGQQVSSVRALYRDVPGRFRAAVLAAATVQEKADAAG